MQLFDQIFEKIGQETLRVERRESRRFPVNREFPLKAVLSFVGRDDTGAPMGDSRHNWTWKGRLVDLSDDGARMQLGHGVKSHTGDDCDLLLTLEDVEMSVPSSIANVNETEDGTIVGLQHRFGNDDSRELYLRMVEVVALGASLQSKFKATAPDESGYLMEQYSGGERSQLTVWRDGSDGGVVAFEFRPQGCLIRAAAGHKVEYLTETGAAEPAWASDVKSMQLHRLFQWVVPNLSSVVPDDVRTFLRGFAK